MPEKAKQNASKEEGTADQGPVAAQAVAPQPPVTPSKDSPANADWEARYKSLQKTHEELVGKYKLSQESGFAMKGVEKMLVDINGRMEGMESTNTLMQIHTLSNADEHDKAQRLALSAISQRLSTYGIEYNDPMLEGVRATADDPVKQFELFRATEPILRNVSQLKQQVSAPLQNNVEVTPSEATANVDVNEIRDQARQDLLVELNQHYSGGPTGPAMNLANLTPSEKIRMGIQQIDEQKK